MDKRKPLPINPELKEYAVKMRNNMTDEEKKVWYQILKGHVPKFHRQRIIGNYIVDFFCPKLKLIIEIDGEQHFWKENEEYEIRREKFFTDSGFKLLHFYNSDINKHICEAEHTITTACRERAEELGLSVEVEFKEQFLSSTM
jgi:very-short-patch-repair endonuclease